MATTLQDILTQVVAKTEHHVKNSQHLASELAGITVDENENLNSHNVVSLSTITLVNKALEVIKERLLKDTKWKEATQLEIDDTMELLEFVLTATYSTFGDKYTVRGSAPQSVVQCLL